MMVHRQRALTLTSALILGLVVIWSGCSDSAGDPSANCEPKQLLTNADIKGGTTLPAGSCYLVNENLTLSDGTVIAEAGVVVEFATNIAFRINSGGQLRLAGTEAAPVRLTSQDPVASWKGLRLNDSQGSSNSWTYATIDRAGSAKWTGAGYSAAAVYLEGLTTLQTDHVTISNSKAHGLLATANITLTASALTLDGNETPAYLHPQVADTLGSATLSNNANNYLRVVFGNNDRVEGEHSWGPQPYRIEDRFFIGGRLTIEPGAVLEFAEDASMIVNPNATLTAKGTSDSPITFKGANGTKGYWKGIEIKSGGTGTPATIGATFDHCLIEDAGGQNWSGAGESQAMLYLQDTSAALITNTTFQNSARYGLWAGANARVAGFSNNTFTNNTRVMLLHPDRVGELKGDSTITGNDDDGIYVVFGNNDKVTADATWKNLSVPYMIRDRFFVQAALSIDAGVTISFPQDKELIVDPGGSLTIDGTASAPVTLEGANKITSGYWKGLRIKSNDTANKLSHTTVAHAGSANFTGDAESSAAIYLEASARVSLDNVTLGPGGGHGVFIGGSGSTIASLGCTEVTFSGLAKDAVWQDAADSAAAACP